MRRTLKTTSATRTLAMTAAVLFAAMACGAEYHVDPAGNDDNPGTRAEPFRTVAQAVEVARAGDTCVLHEGTYRESVKLKYSGKPDRPVRVVAAQGEKVVLSGLDPIEAEWTPYRGSIYKAQVPGPVRQLFVDGRPMTEARWPNLNPDDPWDRSTWEPTGKGSRYGKIVDPKLAETGVDFTGAVAVLNVAHQFYTWTRTVTGHAAGSDTLEYPKDLDGITSFADKTKPWENNRYYLFGKLEVLDVPGEWFHDADTGTLYLWMPGGGSPQGHRIESKVRDTAFEGKRGLKYAELHGLWLVGCCFAFPAANDVLVEDCRMLYPTFARRMEEKQSKEDSMVCLLIGDGNTVRRCAFAYGSTAALKIVGAGNLVEDCLMHDFCTGGSLKHQVLTINGRRDSGDAPPSVARHNTLYNSGNAVLGYRGPGIIVEYNHVYRGGLACEDVALVYTGQPETAGNIVRYNWVHDCVTEHNFPGGLRGGLGIRGDDQTRSLTVHHNVVWNCGRDGIIVKGDDNKVYNNTVFNIGFEGSLGNYINMHTMAEPEKWWRKQHPLLPEQNRHSVIANNAARTITGDNKSRPYEFKENLQGNYQGADLKLVDPPAFDFRPQADSPLVDAGVVIKGLVEKFQGKAPDVGAYERGGERWLPGITWDPSKVLGHVPPGYLDIRPSDGE